MIQPGYSPQRGGFEMSQHGHAPMREVAQRAFAAKFNDAAYTFQESEDDRAPVYALLPQGEGQPCVRRWDAH